jgi:hypothetical protein
MGEVTVPFPDAVRVQQYHLQLEKNPVKMSDPRRDVTGTISLQVRWHEDLQKESDSEALLPVSQPTQLDSISGVLGISPIRAIGIMAADVFFSDPYCVVYVHTGPMHNRSWTTSTVENTLNPEWDQSHEFCINWPKGEFLETKPHIKLEVWDWDPWNADDFLGEVTIPLPVLDTNDCLDLELRPNRTKGATMVSGRMHVQLYFRNEFHPVLTEIENTFSSYEQVFCDYFGERHVNEQLAQALAPQLAYLHLDSSRIRSARLRRAWHSATCGFVGPRSEGSAQGAYLTLSAALWFALAVCAALLSAWPTDNRIGGGVVLGFAVAVALPNLAHVLAQFFWHGPRIPAPSWIPSWRHPTADDPVGFAVVVMVASWIGLAVFLIFENSDETLVGLALSATLLLVLRLLLLPLVHALFWTLVLTVSKRSSLFDQLIWRYPSVLVSWNANPTLP